MSYDGEKMSALTSRIGLLMNHLPTTRRINNGIDSLEEIKVLLKQDIELRLKDYQLKLYIESNKMGITPSMLENKVSARINGNHNEKKAPIKAKEMIK